jgi:transketolase
MEHSGCTWQCNAYMRILLLRNDEPLIPIVKRLRTPVELTGSSCRHSMTNHAGLGHTGGDLSSADIPAMLYFGRVLRVDPADPTWPQRDRFIMSKGHCSGAFYSTLAFRGSFPEVMLATFMDPLSKPPRCQTPRLSRCSK